MDKGTHLLNAIVCIIKSFLCHNITQAMSYHIMELICHDMSYVTITASLVSSYISF